jgi:acetylglutamate kinase
VVPAASDNTSPSSERKLISQLLGHFKQTAEVRQYLKFYGSVEGQRFALIRVSGDVLTSPEETARVASSLAFLHRIGLVPIVVHGAGLFTGRRSASVAGAADVAAAARRYMHEANAALVAALQREGVAAAPLSGSVFSAEPVATEGADSAEFSSICGRVTGVRGDLLTSAVASGRIPIVAALSEPHLDAAAESAAGPADAAAPFLTFSTQDACAALARSVRPLKVIWLRPEGGLRSGDGSGSPVRSIDFAEVEAQEEAAAAVAGSGSAAAGTAGLLPEDAALLPELRSLYAAMSEGASAASASADNAAAAAAGLPPAGGVSVSVTKPEHLAAELFTSRGEGTVLLRRERIRAVHPADAAGLDVARITELIQEAFGATLPADYFGKLLASPVEAADPSAPSSRRLRRIYVSEGYRGVAIVTEEAGLPGVAYLDKFAVAKSAQGDKLGEALWRSMMETERGVLYWRSRSSNRVNPWYYEQSSGCFKAPAGDWTVFWCGLPQEQVLPAVGTALALKPTFPTRVFAAVDAAAGGAQCRGPAEQPVLK